MKNLLKTVNNRLDGNGDLITKKIDTAFGGVTLLFLDSVTSKTDIGLLVIRPLTEFSGAVPSAEFVAKNVISVGEVKCVKDVDEIIKNLFSGQILLFFDLFDEAVSADVKKFETRAVNSPDTEVSQYGSRESFVENISVNTSLIVRRLKTEKLKIKNVFVGEEKSTKLSVLYLEDRADANVVSSVTEKLENCNAVFLNESGYLKEILEPKRHAFFETVGMTVRPDVLCSKLCEGRVAVLCENSPEAVFLPYLVTERFQTPDDYIERPYFAAFSRVIKMLSTVISTLAIGIYIALVQFNPEVFPSAILYNVIDNDTSTPFTVSAEALFLLFVYEMMREAGKRLPKSVGQSASIVGSLVIGDAVVKAGLIGAPTVAVCAFGAIASFLVPEFYNQTAILRLVCILVAVLTGIYGVALFSTAILVFLCGRRSFGVPVLSPISPFSKRAMRDTFFRQNHQSLDGFYMTADEISDGVFNETD